MARRWHQSRELEVSRGTSEACIGARRDGRIGSPSQYSSEFGGFVEVGELLA
jgi:hypothetical protein